MGFTHYISRKEILHPKKFKKASADCKQVVESLGLCLASVGGVPGTTPKFTEEYVSFNGVGSESHEGFTIRRDQSNEESKHNFCKTARKPYDLAVCCCLIVFNHYFGKAFQVDSDAWEGSLDPKDDDPCNWPAARENCQKVLGYGSDFKLPLPLFTGRLTSMGFPIVKREVYSDRVFHTLKNGYRLGKYSWSRRRPLGESHGVHIKEPGYGTNGETIAVKSNLAEARVYATAHWFRKTFGYLGEDAVAFIDTYAQTGDINGLRALSDWCFERNLERAEELLSATLPSRPATVRF